MAKILNAPTSTARMVAQRTAALAVNGVRYTYAGATRFVRTLPSAARFVGRNIIRLGSQLWHVIRQAGGFLLRLLTKIVSGAVTTSIKVHTARKRAVRSGTRKAFGVDDARGPSRVAKSIKSRVVAFGINSAVTSGELVGAARLAEYGFNNALDKRQRRRAQED